MFQSSEQTQIFLDSLCNPITHLASSIQHSTLVKLNVLEYIIHDRIRKTEKKIYMASEDFLPRRNASGTLYFGLRIFSYQNRGNEMEYVYGKEIP